MHYPWDFTYYPHNSSFGSTTIASTCPCQYFLEANFRKIFGYAFSMIAPSILHHVWVLPGSCEIWNNLSAEIYYIADNDGWAWASSHHTHERLGGLKIMKTFLKVYLFSLFFMDLCVFLAKSITLGAPLVEVLCAGLHSMSIAYESCVSHRN